MTANQPEELRVLEEEMNKRKAHFVLVILQLPCVPSLTGQHTASPGPLSLPVLSCFS